MIIHPPTIFPDLLGLLLSPAPYPCKGLTHVGVEPPAGFYPSSSLARRATSTLPTSYLTLALRGLKTIEAGVEFLSTCTYFQLVPRAGAEYPYAIKALLSPFSERPDGSHHYSFPPLWLSSPPLSCPSTTLAFLLLFPTLLNLARNRIWTIRLYWTIGTWTRLSGTGSGYSKASTGLLFY